MVFKHTIFNDEIHISSFFLSSFLFLVFSSCVIGVKPLLAGAKITMNFSHNKVSGSSGCNRYFSSYQSTSENIKFSEAVVTKMWCAFPEGVMRQEAAFLKQLPEVEGYSYEGSRLTFKRFNGEAALTLSKK
jgi:heat shock protein HslJ